MQCACALPAPCCPWAAASTCRLQCGFRRPPPVSAGHPPPRPPPASARLCRPLASAGLGPPLSSALSRQGQPPASPGLPPAAHKNFDTDALTGGFPMREQLHSATEISFKTRMPSPASAALSPPPPPVPPPTFACLRRPPSTSSGHAPSFVADLGLPPPTSAHLRPLLVSVSVHPRRPPPTPACRPPAVAGPLRPSSTDPLFRPPPRLRRAPVLRACRPDFTQARELVSGRLGGRTTARFLGLQAGSCGLLT